MDPKGPVLVPRTPIHWTAGLHSGSGSECTSLPALIKSQPDSDVTRWLMDQAEPALQVLVVLNPANDSPSRAEL